MAVRRQFDLTERLKLQLRAEAFNVFNRANFGYSANNRTFINVSSTGSGSSRKRTEIPNATFGQSTLLLSDLLSGFSGGGSTPGFNQLYTVGGPRSMQFAVKLLF
jgi:hypothetical protein